VPSPGDHEAPPFVENLGRRDIRLNGEDLREIDLGRLTIEVQGALYPYTLVKMGLAVAAARMDVRFRTDEPRGGTRTSAAHNCVELCKVAPGPWVTTDVLRVPHPRGSLERECC